MRIPPKVDFHSANNVGKTRDLSGLNSANLSKAANKIQERLEQAATLGARAHDGGKVAVGWTASHPGLEKAFNEIDFTEAKKISSMHTNSPKDEAMARAAWFVAVETFQRSGPNTSSVSKDDAVAVSKEMLEFFSKNVINGGPNALAQITSSASVPAAVREFCVALHQALTFTQ